MTAEEKQKMMLEIMQVVDKHIQKSDAPKTTNKYGRQYGIKDEEMARWKEEYRLMRVEGRKILEEVRSHPIDVSLLKNAPSFNILCQKEIFEQEN